MVSVETITLMVLNYITLLIVGFLTVSLFKKFKQKKTTGTLLLFTYYLVLFIFRIVAEVTRIIQLLGFLYMSKSLLVVMAATSLSSTLIAIFLYAFACRGLITDSEFVRTLVITFLGIMVGALYAIYVYGIYYPISNPLFMVMVTPMSDDLYTLRSTFVTLAMMVSSFIIYLRIAFSTFRLAKNSNELVRKRGFQFIAWGLIIFLLGGIFTGLFAGMRVDILAVNIVVEIFNKAIFIAAYIMLYIGWTMPNWFRKRMRKKSWFAQQYSAEATV